MNKCALFDTDFISKLHITRKDDENRLIDRIMELPGYQFACHEQICIELRRHNASATNGQRPDYPVQAEFPVSAPSHPSMF